jgi:hypothetical protein
MALKSVGGCGGGWNNLLLTKHSGGSYKGTIELSSLNPPVNIINQPTDKQEIQVPQHHSSIMP